jgi:hypothetical protein
MWSIYAKLNEVCSGFELACERQRSDFGLTAICDRFDATTVSAVDANDRRCSNLRELESRLSLAAQGVEKVSSSLLDGRRVNPGVVKLKRRLVKLIRRMSNTIMAVLPIEIVLSSRTCQSVPNLG